MSKKTHETRLRSWRVSHRLRLQDLADAATNQGAPISIAMLSLVERGERRMSPMLQMRLAKALHVRLSDLFEPETEPPSIHRAAALEDGSDGAQA